MRHARRRIGRNGRILYDRPLLQNWDWQPSWYRSAEPQPVAGDWKTDRWRFDEMPNQYDNEDPLKTPEYVIVIVLSSHYQTAGKD